MVTENEAWWHTPLDQATEENLFAELRRRGWQIGIEDKSVLNPKTVRIQNTPQSGQSVAPEEEWLEVWQHLEIANGNHQVSRDHLDNPALLWNFDEHVWHAVRRLFLLLEPPSVRERRLNNE